MFNRDIASRLSGECSVVAHYVRTGITGHHIPELDQNRARKRPKAPNPYKKGYERERDRRERRAPLKPLKKAPALPTKELSRYGGYGDFAQRPFGQKPGKTSSSKSIGKGLTRAGKGLLGRYVRPMKGFLDIVAQGNLTGVNMGSFKGLERAMQQAGWTLKCASNSPPSPLPWTDQICVWGSGAASPLDPPLCGNTLQVVHFLVSKTNPTINWDGYRTIVYGPGSTGTPNRMTMWAHYTRPGLAGPRIRLRTANSTPPPDYVLPPQIDPMQLPIKSPVHTPQPIPWKVIPHRKPNPMRVEQSEGSEPSLRPQPQPATQGLPPGKYIPVGEVVVTPPPRPGRPPVVIKDAPGVHVRRPPRNNEDERKVGKIPLGLVGEALSVVTEAGDVAGAFFYAISQKDRPRDPGTPWDQAVFVAQNLDKVQLPKLLGNLIIMLITDAAAGKWGKAQRDLNRKLYDDFGIDLSGHLPKKYLQPEVRI